MNKHVHFNNKVKVYKIPEKEQYKYYTKQLDKEKYYNLFDVKYSRELMKKYDIIQSYIFKLLNKKINEHAIIHKVHKNETPIKINREDIFWTEDNSPISFMKHILDTNNLDKFCKSFLKFIKSKMKIKDKKKIRYLYQPFVITFQEVERIS